MSPGLSVPTDNIYKFYTLFGFTLLVSTLLGYVYVYDSSRTKMVQWTLEILEYEAGGSGEVVNPEKKELLLQLVNVEKENRQTYQKVLALVSGFALFLFVIGLYKWQNEVQPREDDLYKLRILSAETELLGMGVSLAELKRRELNRNPRKYT
ncbi:hypothetical protein [Neptuniibacter sp. QD37_11]|uniref:hypothetical protein n=1 Tax=Neptuniibacter sp. QD37_11 TaxID=3398209 RepID=UPI0039F63D2F